MWEDGFDLDEYALKKLTEIRSVLEIHSKRAVVEYLSDPHQGGRGSGREVMKS